MKRIIIICAVSAGVLVLGSVGALCFALGSGGTGLLKGLEPSFRLGLHLGLGESAYESRQYSLAEQFFKQAFEDAAETGIETDRAEALTRLGQTLKRLGKQAQAKEKLSQAYDIYDRANEDFMLTVDRRVKKQCLEEYAGLLKVSGDEKLAQKISAEHQKLRDELGPVEKLREKVQEF